MAAASNATIKDTFFHPQHPLIKRHSHCGSSSFYLCDACGLGGTGIRYHCNQCDFDIHEACLTGLPRFISICQIGGRDIGCTLTRLDASWPCKVCDDTSPAGRYMYFLALPAGSGVNDLYLHPRCALLLTGKQDFHTQHLLSVFYYYDDALTPCAVCERACTGVQFHCGECDFNIDNGCLSLPRSISYAMHSTQHELILTRLKGSRWCDICNETSNTGCYMYRCVPCNYDVHPRCVALLAVPLVGNRGGVVVQPQQRLQGLNRPAPARPRPRCPEWHTRGG